jgi:hypothetical protein
MLGRATLFGAAQYALWRDRLGRRRLLPGSTLHRRFYTPCGVTVFGTCPRTCRGSPERSFYTPCAVTVFGILPFLAGL